MARKKQMGKYQNDVFGIKKMEYLYHDLLSHVLVYLNIEESCRRIHVVPLFVLRRIFVEDFPFPINFCFILF